MTGALPALMARPRTLSSAQLRVSTLLAALVLLAQCRRELPEPDHSGPEALPTASFSAPAAPLHRLPSPVGEWVESKRYRLRAVSVSPCDESGVSTSALVSSRAPRDAAGQFRLGVAVEIEADAGNTLSPVFVSPKAATLEKDGKLFPGSAQPTPSPACPAPLEPRRLRPGESTRGTLIFEAPDITYLRSAVLRFRPPRWGGELRVDVQLPDCFGNGCPESPRF